MTAQDHVPRESASERRQAESTSPVSVLIIGLHYAPEPTGNAPYTTKLAEGLTAMGHRVEVITGYPHYPQWRIADGYSGLSTEESINGVTVRRLRHTVPSVP